MDLYPRRGKAPSGREHKKSKEGGHHHPTENVEHVPKIKETEILALSSAPENSVAHDVTWRRDETTDQALSQMADTSQTLHGLATPERKAA